MLVMLAAESERMRPRAALAAGAAAELGALGRGATRLDEYRRRPCVSLRGAFQESTPRIGQITGLALGTSKNIPARELKAGAAGLKTRPRGGRQRENLTVAEEEAVGRPFLDQAQGGGIGEMGPIKRAYEAKVARTAPPSTVYRVGHRHSWRKVVPRPRHPQAAPTGPEALKKTLPLSWPDTAKKPRGKAPP